FSRGDAVVVPITLAAMPCRNHSHREKRKSVWMCAESTATVIFRGIQRGTVRHASAHTEQRTHTAKQKQGAERNDPKSRQRHTWRASCSRVIITARDASPRPAVAKTSLQTTVQILIFCVLEKRGKMRRSTGRHINRAIGTAGRQRYMRHGPNLNNHARWQHTPIE
ncbi:hypothetical protein TcCL_NonESM12159, partial [Trypanosoma cruzi]